MAIEIVDFTMKNGDFPWQNVSSPEAGCSERCFTDPPKGQCAIVTLGADR